MKPLLFCLAATATAAAVSLIAGVNSATPTFKAYDNERMVLVPGLEKLGPSRISSVEFCAKDTGSGNWQQLVTDLHFDRMEACLIDLT